MKSFRDKISALATKKVTNSQILRLTLFVKLGLLEIDASHVTVGIPLMGCFMYQGKRLTQDTVPEANIIDQSHIVGSGYSPPLHTKGN